MKAIKNCFINYKQKYSNTLKKKKKTLFAGKFKDDIEWKTNTVGVGFTNECT